MEHDSPWKDAVEDLFEDFLYSFFPLIHKDIDFSKGYEFLEKELQKITKTSKTGRRYADKLVKVFLKNGAERWLLIHIEIQGYRDKKFPERMYTYNYRIFDKFRKKVISLAILTDTNPGFRPNEYRRSDWGCEVIFRYPIVKVIDYRDRVAELEASSNPFAIIVLAYLKTLETEGDVQARYAWKKHFLMELYKRGMKRKKFLAIYRFIDWMMKLSEKLDSRLHNDIKTTKEAKAMPYITTAERIGMKEGIKQSMPTIHQAIALAIQAKFGKSGQPLIKRAYQMRDLETLQKVMKKLMRAESLPEARKAFVQKNVRRH